MRTKADSIDSRIAAARRFNRFYTRRIGVLGEGLIASPYPLAEVRVLYELSHRERPIATVLGEELGLDPGYLSRILRAFAARGWLTRRSSPADARRRHLALTRKGRRAFAALDARSRAEMRGMLAPFPSAAQRRLVNAMATIEEVLVAAAPRRHGPIVLRPPRPGDLGWVVYRHGTLYAEEYGWDEKFEALVAGIVSEFVARFDSRRERCWIAERDGERVGSVFLVRESATVAKLRLLLVEPSARGAGIGRRLVEECVRFAREAGYRRITLWTQKNLGAARRLYADAGFRLTASRPHVSFGRALVAETWDLVLRAPGRSSSGAVRPRRRRSAAA